MTETPPLSAFFDAVEQRAFVALWLINGNRNVAERALMATLRAFRQQAVNIPREQWPIHFWRLLVSTPSPGSEIHDWPGLLDYLAGLDDPARRALLLRFVAGMREAEAAWAMQIDEAHYRHWLSLACPRDEHGRLDEWQWRQIADAVNRLVQQLRHRPEALARIHNARLEAQRIEGQEDGAQGRVAVTHWPATERAERLPVSTPVSPMRSDFPRRPKAARRRRRVWLLGVAVLGILILGAGFMGVWIYADVQTPETVLVEPGNAPEARIASFDDGGEITMAPLPPEPLPRRSTQTAVAAPPVYEPVVLELALLSWYAAGMPESQLERERPPLANRAQEPRSADMTRSVGVRTTTEEPAVAQAAWDRLSIVQRQRVRTAAALFADLSFEQQSAIRLSFSDLDRLEQRGWLLGPELGKNFAALQPLIGLVSDRERDPLLTLLHMADSQQIQQLVTLAQRVPAEERAAVRRELLHTPPAHRSAWLGQRLH